MMGRVADWLDALRYDHPGLYRVLLVGVATSALFATFMLLPDSPLMRAIGISSIQARVAATANGIYWSARGVINPSGTGDHHQVWGSVDGVDQSGKLIVTVPQGKDWVRQTVTLANVEILDLYGVAQIVGSLRLESARFDIYEGQQCVVWIRNTPFNVKLIEAGVAKPASKPPTNIFDLAFATYYWTRAKGKSL